QWRAVRHEAQASLGRIRGEGRNLRGQGDQQENLTEQATRRHNRERGRMPTYEYECQGCRHRLEARQSMKDAPLKKCPECKQPRLARIISGGLGFIPPTKTVG